MKRTRKYAAIVGVMYSLLSLALLWKAIEVSSYGLLTFAFITAVFGPFLQEGCKDILAAFTEEESEKRKEVNNGNSTTNIEKSVC